MLRSDYHSTESQLALWANLNLRLYFIIIGYWLGQHQAINRGLQSTSWHVVWSRLKYPPKRCNPWLFWFCSNLQPCKLHREWHCKLPGRRFPLSWGIARKGAKCLPFSGSKHFFRPLPSSRRCGLDRSQKQMEGHLHPADDPEAFILLKESKAVVPDPKQIFKGRTSKQSKSAVSSHLPSSHCNGQRKGGKKYSPPKSLFCHFRHSHKSKPAFFFSPCLLLCPTTYFLHLQNQRVRIRHANSLWIESRLNESLFKNRRFWTGFSFDLVLFPPNRSN